MLPESRVGRDKIVVTLLGVNSTGAVFVDRMCGEGRFALPGAWCQPCPAVSIIVGADLTLAGTGACDDTCCWSVCVLDNWQHATCPAFYPAPLPQAGFFAVSATVFEACTPPESCRGIDVSAINTSSLSLDPFYDESVRFYPIFSSLSFALRRGLCLWLSLAELVGRSW